jgi:putative copper resistance protein D
MSADRSRARLPQEGDLNDPIIYVRAVHFAATLLVAGVAFFKVFIAEPAFRKAGADTRVTAIVRLWLRRMAWTGFALAVLSGAAWLVVTAAAMSDEPLGDVISNGVLSTVLTQTTFGHDWLIRSVLACSLAAAFVPFLAARTAKPVWLDAVAVILAAALAGTLAWAGHAAGGLGVEALVHPVADVLHLIAAAAWIGALPPLLVLLATVGDDDGSIALARTATVRFSTLGIFSVGTLVFTGIINTWYLVGSVQAMVETDYGRLLLEKIAIFVGLVILAAANRLWLTPQLLKQDDAGAIRGTLFQLRYHVALEVAAGACIILIVAVLGTMHPGLHVHVHEH